MALRDTALRIPRFLTQNKAFAACVVFSLGVGISVSAGIVAMVDSARNGPVPFENADRLEVVYISDGTFQDFRHGIRPEVVRALAAPGSPFEDAALWNYSRGNEIRDGDRIESGWLIDVTPNFPRLFSARMHIGRPFGVNDSPEARYLMLSYRFWASDWSADSTIVGRTVFIDSVPHLVTGVTAPEWNWPDRIEAWKSNPDILTPVRGRQNSVLMFGLRKEGIDPGQARAMVSTIGTAAMITKSSPRDRIYAQGFREYLALNLSTILFALGLGALFIAFITAVNFAGLVLARGIRRRAEIGVRAALGASVGRLVRQIVGETIWLSTAGGLLAAMLAPGVLNVIRISFESSMPSWLTISMSWRVVAASVGMSLLLGVVFAIGPALDLARPALGTFLRSTGTGLSASTRAQRSRAGLVSVQVALATAFLVLFGALLGRALMLTRPDPGYAYQSIIRGSINRTRNTRDVETRMLSVQASVQQIQGVSRVALLQSQYLRPDEVAFDGATGDTSVFQVLWTAQTSEAFFDIVRPRLVAGRLPTQEEYRGRAPVAVITEVVARRAFDGGALGKTIRIGKTSLSVIGVVEKLQRGAISMEDAATIVSPIIERPDRWTSPEVWIQISDPSRVPVMLRDLQQEAELGALGARVRLGSAAAEMRREMQSFRAIGRVIVAVFVIAMALAAMGIYGLVAYTVEMRNREMAIREALGATKARVTALLLRSAAIQTLIGLTAGAALATGLARLIREHNLVLSTAVQSTAVAFVLVALTVLASSFGPLRATWRRDLSHVLRD